VDDTTCDKIDGWRELMRRDEILKALVGRLVFIGQRAEQSSESW